MNKTTIRLTATALVGIFLAFASGTLTGCGKEMSPEDRIKQQISERVHSLNADERLLAQANARSYFEREWINADNKRGQLLLCRPSDSNFNGLVTCSGMKPRPDGTYFEATVYCGYRPELVGCSDKDQVN